MSENYPYNKVAFILETSILVFDLFSSVSYELHHDCKYENYPYRTNFDSWNINSIKLIQF